MNGYSLKLLENKKDADYFILNIHYAKRKPSISYAFGLYFKNDLVGVCTFGSPPSPSLAESIVGKENKSLVIELNRLVLLLNNKNEASFLVGHSLKKLSKPSIVVSVADENKNHKGTVYQAANFLYTGMTRNNFQYIDNTGKEFHFRQLGHYQKNNRLNVGLVKRRSNEKDLNYLEIVTYLRKNRNGYKIKEIDKHFGYKDTAAHWFRTDQSNFSYPSVDDWIELKKLLNFDNTYDNLMTQSKMVADRKEIIKELKLKKIKIKGKHRYIYINANKKDKKNLIQKIKYPILPYPKEYKL